MHEFACKYPQSPRFTSYVLIPFLIQHCSYTLSHKLLQRTLVYRELYQEITRFIEMKFTLKVVYTMFVVHSSSDKNRPHHLMLDHNSEMKAYIEGSFAKYDPFGITQLSNYLHDVGKLTAKNQAILTSENAKRGSVIHAIGGAVVLQDYEDVRAKLAALIVACHHTGLINIQRLFQEKLPAADEDFKQIPFDYPYIGEKIDQILHSNQQFQDQLSSYAHLFVKLSYSALIDADFLSTELYMDERKAVARKDTNSLEFKEYLSLLDAKVRALQQVYSDEPLTKKRSALYYQAKIAGESSQSFLSLVERTGTERILLLWRLGCSIATPIINAV